MAGEDVRRHHGCRLQQRRRDRQDHPRGGEASPPTLSTTLSPALNLTLSPTLAEARPATSPEPNPEPNPEPEP
eukprot:2434285-Prymnesium_polylepis.1